MLPFEKKYLLLDTHVIITVTYVNLYSIAMHGLNSDKRPESKILKGRQFEYFFFFFSELCPFFDLRLFILYQTPHSRPLAPTCCALVMGKELKGVLQCFFPRSKTELIILARFDLSSVNALNLVSS